MLNTTMTYLLDNKTVFDDDVPDNAYKPCGAKVTLVMVKVIFCVSAAFGNTLVILSVLKFRHMRTVDNVLICNLAVSSVFVCVHILTDIANWTFGMMDMSLKYTCLFKTADTIVVIVSSVFNLLLMTIERYIAILLPLRFRAIVTFSRARAAMVVFWLFYSVLAFLPMAGLNTFDMPNAGFKEIVNPSGCNLHDVLIMSYGKIIVSVSLFATTANLVLFIRILCVVYLVNRNRKRDGRTRKSSNRKTFTVLMTLCTFILFWIPFVVAVAVKASKATNVVDLCMVVSPYNIGILYSSFNWLIYGLMRPKFRQCFRAILTCTPLQVRNFNESAKETSTSSTLVRRNIRDQ